jgi:hypothetical protein
MIDRFERDFPNHQESLNLLIEKEPFHLKQTIMSSLLVSQEVRVLGF